MRMLIVSAFFCLFPATLAIRTIKNGLGTPEIVVEPKELVWEPKCEVRGAKLDILFILDSSGSLRNRFQDEINVIKRILDIVAIAPDATRAALVQYSGIQRTEFHFNTFTRKKNILQAMDTLRHVNGITKTGAALEWSLKELTLENGMRTREVPKIVFLLSDGRTHDFPKDREMAEQMKRNYPNLQIWAYGTGDYVAIEELIGMTGDKDKIVTNRDLHRLDLLFEAFKGVEICEPKPVCIPGSDKPLDLIFIIDSSKSIDETFSEEVKFAQRVMGHVNVHPQAVRVACIVYSGNVKIEFDFNRFTNADDVIQAMGRMTGHPGTTRTDVALRKAFTLFNNGSSGAREGVKRMAIVLTDGHSQKPPGIYARRLTRLKDVKIASVAVGEERTVDFIELLAITDRKFPDRVFTRSRLHNFEASFFNKYVGHGCPDLPGLSSDDFIQYVRGAVQTSCQPNAMTFSIRTLRDFYGWVYVKDYFEHPACVTRGDGSPNVRMTLVHSRNENPQCGMTREVYTNDTFEGYKFNITVMLQFHDQVVTRVDQGLELVCYAPASVGNILGESTLKSVMNTECQYSLSRFNKDGCVALDARVGDRLFHSWKCDSSPIYGMLVHDCFVESDEKVLPILDHDGCQTDPFILETPMYDTRTRNQAWSDFAAFKFPLSSSVRFRCKISLCDMESGQPCTREVASADRRRRGSRPAQPAHCKGRGEGGRQKRSLTSSLSGDKKEGGYSATFDVETRRLNVLENESLKPELQVKYCLNFYNR